eukprot:359240-Chlamydomonas_euryale.AAC.11
MRCLAPQHGWQHLHQLQGQQLFYIGTAGHGLWRSRRGANLAAGIPPGAVKGHVALHDWTPSEHGSLRHAPLLRHVPHDLHEVCACAGRAAAGASRAAAPEHPPCPALWLLHKVVLDEAGAQQHRLGVPQVGRAGGEHLLERLPAHVCVARTQHLCTTSNTAQHMWHSRAAEPGTSTCSQVDRQAARRTAARCNVARRSTCRQAGGRSTCRQAGGQAARQAGREPGRREGSQAATRNAARHKMARYKSLRPTCGPWAKASHRTAVMRRFNTDIRQHRT